MDGVSRILLASSVLLSLFFSASAQSCRSYTFSSNRVFSSCNDLPYLNAFLHWTYDPNTRNLQIAYRHGGITSPAWVAWAINPTGTGMPGAQALVAIYNSDGTTTARTSAIVGYNTQLANGTLSFPVTDLTSAYENNELIIFATLGLQSNTIVNQVWQDGPLSNGGTPLSHLTSGDHMISKGTLDLVSGQSASSGGNSRDRKRNTHGVLNAVSWGIMMPVGALIARYLKVFKSADPAWFYLHVGCQSSAYIIGVAGWATGIKLGSESKGVQHDAHRTIGIILFGLGTLQVFALLLRPQKDHKYRFYWNIYHHLVGYTVIILSVVNIFKGFNILQLSNKKWRTAYMGVIIALAANAALLEAFTWFVVLKRKRSGGDRKMGVHGENGVTNGYGSAP